MTLPFETLPSKVTRGVSIVVFGPPGRGKTTLAATLPAGPGETLIINTEAGIAPLMGTKHLIFNLQKAITNGKNVEVVMNTLYKSIRTGEKGYNFKNIVIDNVSELSDQLTNHYTKIHNKDLPEIREHGDTSFKFREWIHNWRDLVEMGTNVVFNAWDQDYDIAIADGVVTTRTCPKVGKANVPSVCGLCDVVGHLEVHDKTDERWLRIGPHRQYITKTQFKGLKKGEIADLPTIINKIKEYNYSEGAENG